MPSSWAPSTARDRPATIMSSAGMPYITHCSAHTAVMLLLGHEESATGLWVTMVSPSTVLSMLGEVLHGSPRYGGELPS